MRIVLMKCSYVVFSLFQHREQWIEPPQNIQKYKTVVLSKIKINPLSLTQPGVYWNVAEILQSASFVYLMNKDKNDLARMWQASWW